SWVAKNLRFELGGFGGLTGLLGGFATEGHAQRAQKFTRMIVVVRGSHEGDVKTQSALDFVELDFRENGLVADAQRVVATAVKGLWCHTAEVADTWDGGLDQTHHEIIHAAAAQSHFHTHRFTLAEFEV